jgi:hypothetical protein
MQYFLLVTSVLTGIVAISYLIPMARRDGDVFGSVCAGVVATVGIAGCFLTGRVLLARQATNAGVADFLSFILLCAFLWVVGCATFREPTAPFFRLLLHVRRRKGISRLRSMTRGT